MENSTSDLLAEVAEYYSAKLAEHGASPSGADWNSQEGQVLRFSQLTRVIRQAGGFSLNDLGCGYGALLPYLQAKYFDFTYTGYDVSSDMVRTAQAMNAASSFARFVVASMPPEMSDYGFASGIFNVRFGRSDAEWSDYLQATLAMLDQTSRRGFAFNCLTSYSDADKMRSDLYYADPCMLFDLCKRRYSRNVALLHDYGLYEFTILVSKIP